MDAVLPVLCLAAGVLLTLGVLAVLTRRALRQLAVVNTYREVARRLQLWADTRGLSVHGRLAGRRLWIGEVMLGFGAGRTSEVRGVVELLRPLGLGLYLHPRGRRGRWFSRASAPERGSGDLRLDRVFHVHADEIAGVKAVLTPKVRAAITHLHAGWPEVEVTDSEVRVSLRAPEASEGRLLALVEAMTAVASALEEARRELPVPSALSAAVAVFEEVAERLSLATDLALPAIYGVWASRQMEIVPVRTAGGFRAQLFLAFAEHPPTGIRLTPQAAPDGYWSVGQDIQLGHPRFDAAFVVKGWDPPGIRGLLSDPTRSALLALAELGTLDLEDRGLTLSEVPIDAIRLSEALERARKVAENLGW